MKLSQLLSPERIRVRMESTAKDDVLRELVSLLPNHRDAETRTGILQAVLEREARMSTGIGQGVAIPHGKTDLVSQMEMAFGIAPAPVDYEALDGEAVDLFFLLVSPPDLSGPHIKVLAQISRMLSSDGFRDELASAASAEAVLELLRTEEAAGSE
ncbi:PTS sugar transporter subunit IIA [bacterium]|nr:PTS sugar transporter subunit IIA [bacterium]